MLTQITETLLRAFPSFLRRILSVEAGVLSIFQGIFWVDGIMVSKWPPLWCPSGRHYGVHMDGIMPSTYKLPCRGDNKQCVFEFPASTGKGVLQKKCIFTDGKKKNAARLWQKAVLRNTEPFTINDMSEEYDDYDYDDDYRDANEDDPYYIDEPDYADNADPDNLYDADYEDSDYYMDEVESGSFGHDQKQEHHSDNAGKWLFATMAANALASGARQPRVTVPRQREDGFRKDKVAGRVGNFVVSVVAWVIMVALLAVVFFFVFLFFSFLTP